MLKLKDKDFQKPVAGLPGSYREWWDLGGGYEIYVNHEENICQMGIRQKGVRNVTSEIADYLGIDMPRSEIKFGGQSNGRELYLTLGIDCYMLNYTKPEKYKELLEKIEKIVEEHFKNK